VDEGADVQSSESAVDPTSSVVHTPESWDDGGSAEAPPRSNRRKRRVIAAALSIVVLGAVGAGVVISQSSKPPLPGAGIVPADFVVSSTQNTLAQRTADITFTGSITKGGTVIPLTGTGQADFVSNSFTGTVSFTSSSESLVERELAVADHFYMGMTIDGHDISQITNGSEWINVPLPQQSGASVGFGSVNPLAQLQYLEKKGAKVVAHGSAVIDGDPVSEYSVTPSSNQILANIQSEIASGQLTSAEGQQALQESKELGSFTTDVWFDASGLLRREAAVIGGGSSGVSGIVNMTFENYGTPVTIQAPAPRDVVDYSQFVSDLQSAKSSSS